MITPPKYGGRERVRKMELMAIPLVLPILTGLVLLGLGRDLMDPEISQQLERERSAEND